MCINRAMSERMRQGRIETRSNLLYNTPNAQPEHRTKSFNNILDQGIFYN